jgi:hypothetical protein
MKKNFRFNKNKNPKDNFELFEKYVLKINPEYGDIFIKDLKENIYVTPESDFRELIKRDVITFINHKLGIKND